MLSTSTSQAGMPWFKPIFVSLNAIFLFIIVLFASAMGSVNIPITELVSSFSFTEEKHSLVSAVFWEIRLPRIVLSMFVGAGLAASGAALQALFRNPMADPGFIGISSGGVLGAVTFIVLGNTLFNEFSNAVGVYAIPLSAMIGCLGVCAIIYQISYKQRHFAIITLLLAGIAINAIVNAIMGVMILISDDGQLRQFIFWSMGNLGGNHWGLTIPVILCISIGLIGFYRLAKPLNLYLLGEMQAQHLGVSVIRLKKQVFILTAITIGASVSISGMIGFVGFIVPHLVRILIGSDHRLLFPASMLLGASLLTLADLLARVVIIPAELPIGLVTSALGGPFFLWVLYRQSARSSL